LKAGSYLLTTTWIKAGFERGGCVVIDTTEHLRVIQEAVSRILKYASKGRSLFDQDELVQAWIIHHLEVIGEVTGSMPQMFRSLHPEIEWKHFTDMREALTYQYYEVNLDRVWAVVENDLPPLKASVDAILTEQETDPVETTV
jgi:uncharacterized protein with HEPN domain